MTVEERRELGRAARKRAPRSALADWEPAAGRTDPVDVLAEQDADRLPWLVPIRHLRMSASVFAFYRGTAAIMAGDLAPTLTSGLTVQACGDAHLSNFGVYGSPERRLVFDVNDFDETHPGPWEWDVARLAASAVLAGRHNAATVDECRACAAVTVSGYRDAMRKLAAMTALDVWYAQIDRDRILAGSPNDAGREQTRRELDKAQRRTNLQAGEKWTEVVEGHVRIKSDPPLLVPSRELQAMVSAEEIEQRVAHNLAAYRESLPAERRALLDRYRLVDVALKVVGVGSVGTRCFIALFEGRDERDPLFLQMKEAGPSVLAPHLGPSGYANAGERVVLGQRLMQASSDIFLGWSAAPEGRDFYWRQLRDMKGSADLENTTVDRLLRYSDLCGRVLARAHARSGDPVAIAAYLGKGESFERALTEFAERYADQAERDYAAFLAALRSGRLESEAPAASPIAA